MPAPIKRANSGSATVDEQGNVGAAPGGMKRTNSDLLQQSQLSFAAKKAVPVPSPVKSKTGAAISTSTTSLRKPVFASASASSSGDISLAPAPAAHPLGAGPETDEMVRNLEMGLYPGDEGLESDTGEEEEEETLVTPQKRRVGKKGSAAEEGSVRVVGQDEDEEDEENALTARKLGDPAKTFGHGSRYRKSMMIAGEAVEAVRAQGAKAAAAAAAGGATKKGAAKKGKIEAAATAGEAPPKLNPKDKKWEGIYWETHKTMGGDETPPIHCTPKSHTRIHHILRVFDLTSEYGPCVGLTRLQRWERANEWGLNPPPEIKEILLTHEGADEDAYRETVFHGTGIYSATA